MFLDDLLMRLNGDPKLKYTIALTITFAILLASIISFYYLFIEMDILDSGFKDEIEIGLSNLDLFFQNMSTLLSKIDLNYQVVVISMLSSILMILLLIYIRLIFWNDKNDNK